MIIPEKTIQKFMRRSDCKDPDEAKKIIKTMIQEGKDIKMKPVRKVLGIINNNFEEARYIKYGEWILVIYKDRVKTCYKDFYGWF